MKTGRLPRSRWSLAMTVLPDVISMNNGWVHSAACVVLFLILAGLFGCASTPELRTRGSTARKAINVEALSPVVRDSTRPDRVRMKAAKELAASTDPKALDPIFSVIRDRQTRPPLRAAMIRVVGQSPQQEAVAAFLVERLADEQENTEVRLSAAAALGSLKNASKESLAPLQRACGDADPTVRLAARWALVRIGGEGIDPIPLLIDILQDPAQPDAAKAPAAERLGELKDARAREALIQALGAKSPDRLVSRTLTLQEFFAGRAAAKRNLPAAAARALGRLGDPENVAPLIDAAEQAQGEAKVAIFEALVALKASQAVPAARQALSDPDQRVRRWAAVLLRQVGAKEALPEMRRALADTDAGVRLQAAMALEQLNDRESVEQIKDALSRETIPEVRRAMEHAVRALSPQ